MVALLNFMYVYTKSLKTVDIGHLEKGVFIPRFALFYFLF